ncbi:MAG: hypothetical protein CM15mP74_29160 [Halieaceae bacterium]|nr:MAG: hypothetical protein CM15mP74_29160 [Halieaceae bacterium]
MREVLKMRELTDNPFGMKGPRLFWAAFIDL